MNYKKSYVPQIGYTPICKIGECSLKQLEFGIVELKKGDIATVDSNENELSFIILFGHADFAFDETKWNYVGGRTSVFGGNATAVYIPRHKTVTITGCEHVKIAVCGARVEEDTEAEIITPDRVRRVTLGVKPWERETTFIVDGNTNAKRLTIGEAYVTPGNWAGFPPHKHDVSNMPHECVSEEVYYFLFDPEDGFGVQCMYTEDGEIDEAYRVKNDDLVEFPYGYHTTVSAPGYNTYFLWLMAGEYQGFYRSNDPKHQWVAAVENLLKK